MTDNPSINRRSFLKMSGALGLGLATWGITPLRSRANPAGNDLHRVFENRLAMGTTVSIILLCASEKKAGKIMELAYKEIDRISGLMNRFDDKSPISRLNREGRLMDAHPDIIKVVTTALKYYRLTHGAFDISIKPVIDLFMEKFSGGKNDYPSKKEIQHALERVGSDKIELKGRDIRFLKPGMSITLDGIAKGYAVDRASKVVLNNNVENHLINAGGDILAMGLRPDGKPWRVAIQDPMKRKSHLDILDLTDVAVATSGNYENYFDREKMFHHIANPKTGRSPVINVSASVIAPTTMDADALATSLLVMSAGDGTRLIDSLPRCESLVISRNNHRTTSAGWKREAP